MIDIRRDPSGDLARVRCDRCGRRGSIRLYGVPRLPFDGPAFARLREGQAGAGWASGPASGDLCARCRRAGRPGTHPP